MAVRRCDYCPTSFEVPDGAAVRTDRTADPLPPAYVTVYASVPEARISDQESDVVVHRCQKGRPACCRCGAIGNALLGHPPAPLVCLRCSRSAAHAAADPIQSGHGGD